MKKSIIPLEQNDFFLYTGVDGKVNVEVFLKDETVWLTQKAMGQLFGVESNTITYHLKEIYKSGELEADVTARKLRAVQAEGEREVTRTKIGTDTHFR
ncbi:MAG: DNA-binding protein [Candidatus Omnitrophica bacterium]|nr:DNA-binding protein [Candidatus Omnitrophota bacterium]